MQVRAPPQSKGKRCTTLVNSTIQNAKLPRLKSASGLVALALSRLHYSTVRIFYECIIRNCDAVQATNTLAHWPRSTKFTWLRGIGPAATLDQRRRLTAVGHIACHSPRHAKWRYTSPADAACASCGPPGDPPGAVACSAKRANCRSTCSMCFTCCSMCFTCCSVS